MDRNSKNRIFEAVTIGVDLLRRDTGRVVLLRHDAELFVIMMEKSTSKQGR